VLLRVENGSGRAGEVRAAAYRLAAAGFSFAGLGDAAERTPTTTIRFGAGQDAAAALVAARLTGGAVLQSDPGLQGVDVVLVIGRDWKGVSEQIETPSSTSTPTSAPSASSSTTTSVAMGGTAASSC
jgi:hypothetical protein